MKPFSLRLTGAVFALAATASLLVSCATTGGDASAVLARSAQAMGATQLNTLRYITEGNGYTFGQAYRPGGAWPKITIHSITRSIDYGTATMRDEIVLSRAEPLGGGGYPLSGQQRNDQFISGEMAWNQAGTTATPGPRFVTDRTAPALDHAARRDQGGDARRRPRHRRRGRRQQRRVRLARPLHRRRRHFRRRPGAPGRVDLRRPGDGRHAGGHHLRRLQSTGGIQFPTRVRQTAGGHPVLDLNVTEVQVNPSLAHRRARRGAQHGRAGDLGEGGRRGLVRRRRLAQQRPDRAGGSADPGRGAAQRRAHAGGDRARQGPGARQADPPRGQQPPALRPLRRHPRGGRRGGHDRHPADNVPFFERAFATESRIRPDAMAKAGRRPTFLAVPTKLDIGDTHAARSRCTASSAARTATASSWSTCRRKGC